MSAPASASVSWAQRTPRRPLADSVPFKVPAEAPHGTEFKTSHLIALMAGRFWTAPRLEAFPAEERDTTGRTAMPPLSSGRRNSDCGPVMGCHCGRYVGWLLTCVSSHPTSRGDGFVAGVARFLTGLCCYKFLDCDCLIENWASGSLQVELVRDCAVVAEFWYMSQCCRLIDTPTRSRDVYWT